MSDEIEDIKKRLLAIETAIIDLKHGSLFMAKRMGREMCQTAYEAKLPYQKGEQRRTYVEFWKKKFDSLEKELETSESIFDVFDKALTFREELVEFFTAPQVDTANKAMEIAHSFIKKYVPVALPLKAERKDDEWLVDIDVGALAVKVAKVKVDARTGDILSYAIPEKK